MIHTNELMLGDWVEFEGLPNRVSWIGNNHVWLNGETMNHHYTSIYGIPITEELLEKCGFEKGPGFLYQIGFDTFITVQVFPDFARLHFKGIVFGDFCFLHELQNAYFMLTKKQLDVKL